MKKYLLVLFALGLLVSACNAGDSSSTLIGTTWRLASYGPADAPVPAVEDAEALLTLNEDGTVAGNSGCNGFGGEYSMEGDQVTFREIISTLIACEEPLMTQEQAVHQVLTDTAAFDIEGDTLTLTNNDMVLVLTR